MKVRTVALLAAGIALEAWNIRKGNALREPVAQKICQNGAPVRLPFKQLR